MLLGILYEYFVDEDADEDAAADDDFYVDVDDDDVDVDEVVDVGEDDDDPCTFRVRTVDLWVGAAISTRERSPNPRRATTRIRHGMG